MHRSSFALASLALGLVAPAAAQQPTVPTGPITLLQAIELGRTQGVNAAIARLDVRTSEARVGERRADLLPTIGGNAGYTRQTINLSEFGLSLPGFPAVTDPVNIYRL